MEQEAVSQIRKKDFTPYRFLLVDDSEFARKNIARVVSMLGGLIAGEASTGREAVVKYQEIRPDIVLMDISMPEMEGVDAVGEIIREDKKATIIMVSSLGHKDLVKKAIASGAKHFITKPVQIEYAAKIVKAVLEGKGG
ncbi:MAG: response regulator [Nitrospirota bacterium]|jgi:two-component system chemotaxis response regulator CheY